MGLDVHYNKDLIFLEEANGIRLLSTKNVAMGYGVDHTTIKTHLKSHSDELLEGQHWVKIEVQTNGGKQKVVHWTLEGIHMLGFFIKSPKAKEFRKFVAKLLTELREERATIVPTPSLIDGKDPHAIIIGLKSQLSQHIKKIEVQNRTIDQLIEENTTLALPAPAVDLQPYKDRIIVVEQERDRERELKEHFSSMAGNQVQKTVALKNVPKILKQHQSQYLDHPNVYNMLGNLAEELEVYIKDRV